MIDISANGAFAERLEVFFGDAHDALSRVYVRLTGPEATPGRRLTGTLIGPFCQYAETLSARFTFADRGPGASLLAEALVPEPCFWTPAMPHQYRATIELREGETVIASAERSIGLRTLGCTGRDLLFDGKRWVLRGVRHEALPVLALSQWHDAATAMIVRHPDDELCAAASRTGVLIVAELTEASVSEIRRLSHWPAVGIVVLPAHSRLDLAHLGHNLLLAERFALGQPVEPSPWATLIVCDAGGPAQLRAQLSSCHLPVIASRPTPEPVTSVAAGRLLCDRLQGELAELVEVSGYIV